MAMGMTASLSFPMLHHKADLYTDLTVITWDKTPLDSIYFHKLTQHIVVKTKIATILQNKFWYDFPVWKYYILDLIPPKSVPTDSINNNA